MKSTALKQIIFLLAFVALISTQATAARKAIIVPTLQRGNASGDAPASRQTYWTLERPGLHSHAGAWER